MDTGHPHPLKVLREKSGLTLIEISKRVHISPSRISLMENFLVTLTAKEEAAIREAIVAGTKELADLVLTDSDPRLRVAMQTIDGRPSAKKLFASLKESGYSNVEAAVFTLGRNYPK